MDHAQHARLAETEINASTLTDATIYGPDDETIGTVKHVHGMGSTMQVIVDVGGFLGIGSKSVAIGVGSIDFMRDEDGTVHGVSTWTKDQVKALPEHHH